MFRLRIIAGPNGSGKTTLTKDLQDNFNLNFGYYINADEIEAILKKRGKLSFKRYKLKVSTEIFFAFFTAHPLQAKCNDVQFSIQKYLIPFSGVKEFFLFHSAVGRFFTHQNT